MADLNRKLTVRVEETGEHFTVERRDDRIYMQLGTGQAFSLHISTGALLAGWLAAVTESLPGAE